MKIAILIPDFSRNGPIIYVEYLVESLLKLDVEIDIYSFKLSENFKFNNVNIHKITFLSNINFDQYDIVHSHTIKADLFALKHLAKIKDKWIITLHNLYKMDLGLLYNPVKARLISVIWGLAFRYCRNFVVFSNSMKDYYVKVIGEKKIEIIRTGVPFSSITDVNVMDHKLLVSLKKKYQIIGSSGHLIKRKGFHQLVRLLATNHKYAVVIVGDGVEKEELKKLAENLGVIDRLFLLGFKKDPISYYKYFDIFVLPSYSEGLPLSLLEALASGLPIVCSKLDNYADHFSENDVCFFDLDDIKSLEQSTKRALRERDYFKEISSVNYRLKFSSEIMAEKHFDLYLKIKK